jgi:hypothetical protein
MPHSHAQNVPIVLDRVWELRRRCYGEAGGPPQAEQDFRKAGETLQEWNAEFVRGALACAEELCPNRSQEALGVEPREKLLKQTELVSP